MRAYFWGNYYLSQIQQGIQALHCVVDIQYKYKYESSTIPVMINDWATNHKTVILLNGGNQKGLMDIHNFLATNENPYPYGYFCEDEMSLNDCLTCVGIILPEKIYEGASFLRDCRTMVGSVNAVDQHDKHLKVLLPYGDQSCDHTYTAWEIDLMNKMNEYRLA